MPKSSSSFGREKSVTFKNPDGQKGLQSVSRELGGLSVSHTIGVLITHWLRGTELERKRSLAEYGRMTTAKAKAEFMKRDRPKGPGRPPIAETQSIVLMGIVAAEEAEEMARQQAAQAAAPAPATTEQNPANMAGEQVTGQLTGQMGTGQMGENIPTAPKLAV